MRSVNVWDMTVLWNGTALAALQEALGDPGIEEEEYKEEWQELQRELELAEKLDLDE
jgi:hypothetical protein